MKVRSEKVSLTIAVAIAAMLSASCVASYDLATASIEEEQYDLAADYLEKGSSEGDERCDYLLGTLMLEGKLGGEPDPEAAARWLARAADAGLRDAQSDLGILYESGNGVQQDMAKAAEWYRKAAVAGHPDSQANLGRLYDSGQGVERDLAQALEWYRKAAEQGNSVGQGELGLALYQGIGASKDVVEGFKWTILAADQHDWTALSNKRAMASQMTVAERSQARQQAQEFRDEALRDPPRRSRLGDMRSQAGSKATHSRRQGVQRPN